MDGGSFPKCALEEEEKQILPLAAASVRIIDAPILLLVCFHKALRSELAELQRITSSLPETGCPAPDFVVDVHNRFQFLRLVYKYHCAAEDQVIFQALDLRVGNVACSYSLEHRGIEELFESIFQCLNDLLEDDGKFFKQFQNLVLCTATIEASISQHMLKEEEQVFPLLVQQFSYKEQASLVWQFICSVPIILLEDFLPWMTSYLPSNEQADAVLCIREVIPKENLLQEVVASWLGRTMELSVRNFNARANDEVASSFNEALYLKSFRKICSSWMSLYGETCSQQNLDSLQDNRQHHPIDGLCQWNAAIKKDLTDILAELCEIRTSKVLSTLASITSQLKFFADVLIFYSEALEKVFFSVLNELPDGSFSTQCFLDDSQIESLLHLLQNIDFEDEIALCKLVDKLCWKLEAFLTGLGNHFTFQEIEVFPLVCKHVHHEMQQKLLYTSLHLMPLGLLKLVISWLSTHLTEAESKAFLCSIKLEGSEADMSFASLLHEWIRIGYSGKSSLEKFRKELQDIFRNRSSFLSEQIESDETLVDDVHSCNRFHLGQVKPNSAAKTNEHAYDYLSNDLDRKYLKLYSSAINLHIFFPNCLKDEKADVGSSLTIELKPIDYIFLFHKALKNDLNYLVRASAEMSENVAFLNEFRHRFHLMKFLYRVHSDNEDVFAFPALEAKGKLTNISLPYTMDHKLELEYVNSISNILDEMSQLTVSLHSEMPTADVAPDQLMLRYRRLCLKLHGMCRTMCIMLGKHVQREEIELWPLFTKYLSSEEQEKIIGSMLGRTRAEVLQKMIPWLMASLSAAEQHAMMSLWRKVTRNTMFNEWLKEWWEGMSKHDIETVSVSDSHPSGIADPLEIAATYLSKESITEFEEKIPEGKGLIHLSSGSIGAKFEPSEIANGADETKFLNVEMHSDHCPDCTKLHSQHYKERGHGIMDLKNQVKQSGEFTPVTKKLRYHEEHFLTMSQEDLEFAIRRVSRDTTLDSKKKAYIIQNLLMSRWIVTQQRPCSEVTFTSTDGQIIGQYPSYRDPLTFGCKHYKRNCKLFAACCNKLFTCRYCHDEEANHAMDRKDTTKMMCMKCLQVQPIGPACINSSCGSSMAKYFCSICRLYDDEREIYHCPYCNLCRVGKGLGIDYFHCMNCNACMSKSLSLHVCREKCFESNCSICHEDIFTSCSPVKSLPCGHLMHSSCFQDYTCTHYTCPICSKSLGDMQVYFQMLDALVAEEKVSQEYHAQTQVILCNDCEKRGVAPFHWLYHKCPHCGSYNTRLA